MADGIPCRYCGEPTTSKRPGRDGTSSHPGCRPVKHGTRRAYREHRCRCDECRGAHAARMREYAKRRKERDGVSMWSGRHVNPAERRRHSRTCRFCGVDFTTTTKATEFCSVNCAQRHRAGWSNSTDLDIYVAPPKPKRQPPPPPKRVAWWTFLAFGPCAHCGQPFMAPCTTLDRLPRYCSDACSKRVHKSARRARKREAFVEMVYRRHIFERDGWRCQLCGNAVNRKAEVPHPKAPVVDHILPLATGGTHEPANAQCAHFLCNSIKSDNAANDQLRLIG